MTIPRPIHRTAQRLADVVGRMLPYLRHGGLTREESSLGIHLRGNQALRDALVAFLKTRIEGRAQQQEPTDPLVCKSWLARDREIQWAINRLDFVFRSPVRDAADDGEQPA
jgi:hypothetical protein